jgi:hypothetical protein
VGGGGVKLGPLATVANNRSIVPAPGDYDKEISGIMIGRGTEVLGGNLPLFPPQTTHSCPDAKPGLRDGMSATNRLSYGTA